MIHNNDKLYKADKHNDPVFIPDSINKIQCTQHPLNERRNIDISQAMFEQFPHFSHLVMDFLENRADEFTEKFFVGLYGLP